MNRASLIRLSTKLVNSVSSTHRSTPNSFNLTKVTHFSLLTKSRSNLYNFSPITHQYFSFSSTPDYLIETLSSKNWSKEIENELEKANPNLTHESLVYILMKLNKDPQIIYDFFKWVSVKKGFKPSSMIYSLLLRVLAIGKFMEQFWFVALEMKEKEFFISESTYLTILGILKREKMDKERKDWVEFYNKMDKSGGRGRVVKDVVDLIMASDWNNEMEKKLNEVEFVVSDEFLLMVIKGLGSQPMKGLRFFKWVSECRGYEHNGMTYNEMAKVLAQGESVGEFWDFVKRMRSEGFEIDCDTYVKISRRLGDRDAVEFFEFAMDGPYKPLVQNCVILLKNLAMNINPDMDLVDRVVKKYKDAGYTLTKAKAIYDGIHRSLCKVGRFDEAQKIVEAIRNAGFEPDNVTYSQEIHGLCKLKKFEAAWKVLEHMEAENCIPDLKTWTILIQGYCLADQIDEALSCLVKMKDKNVDPDADLLQVFVNGFLSQNKVVGAYTFLIEMVKKAHLKPWQATYKLMIEKLLEVGKLEEAFTFLSMMKEHGYPPYPDPFVQYISKSGSIEDAKHFLITALPVKGSPSTSAYVRVIKAFFHEGRHTEAKDILYKSPRAVRINKEIGKLFGSAKSDT